MALGIRLCLAGRICEGVGNRYGSARNYGAGGVSNRTANRAQVCPLAKDKSNGAEKRTHQENNTGQRSAELQRTPPQSDSRIYHNRKANATGKSIEKISTESIRKYFRP